MRTETFDNAADFMAVLNGKPRTKRGRSTRPDLPAAGRAPSTGLTPLLVAGWSLEYRVGAGYRMDRGGLTTGWHESEKAVCDAAKRLT
jgi:hypothetical protein